MSNVRHSAFDTESEKKVKIKEIFASIQGEGPYVGYKQLFIRFCNCNLKCNYCDTEFSDKSYYREFSALELAEEVRKYTDIHSISLTGGEPLLSTEFLKEFLPKIKTKKVVQTPSHLEGEGRGEGENNKPKIYLETNATLAEKFLEIKPYVDIVSADIKLESATGLNTFELHDKFFEACRGVETFAKIVFNSDITDEEIQKSCELGRKYGIELILQPETVPEGRMSGDMEGKLINNSSLSQTSQCHCEEGGSPTWQSIDNDSKIAGLLRYAHNDDTVTLPQQQQTDKNLSAIQPFNPSTDKDLFASLEFAPRLQSFADVPLAQSAQSVRYPDFVRPQIRYSPVRLLTVNPDFAEQILDKFLRNYAKVRLIPQVHKFLNVR